MTPRGRSTLGALLTALELLDDASDYYAAHAAPARWQEPGVMGQMSRLIAATRLREVTDALEVVARETRLAMWQSRRHGRAA